jgi:Acetyltransferase (GNAT) domain
MSASVLRAADIGEVTVRSLTAADGAHWDAFVLAHPDHLGFYTLRYRDFLLSVCHRSRAHYLLAERDGRIVGALPAILSAPGPFGPVLNALPFYGSNGSPLVAHDATDRTAIAMALLATFDDIAAAERVAASTVVSNPLDVMGCGVLRSRPHDCTDHRIGQLTMLPIDPGDGVSREALLLGMYRGKRRNQVRKALTAGMEVHVDDSLPALRAVAALHRDNLDAIGGVAKPQEIFDALGASLRAGIDRQVWVASYNGEPIAYLLVLHTGGVVEYFTPCVRAEFRPMQPLTLLIHHAMCDALHRGARVWNWGGTWTTQHGVYEFKRGWGTTDLPYEYFTRVHDRRLYDATPAQLLAEYPWTYTVPFSRLAR